MITDFLLQGIMQITIAMFSIFPDFPPMPQLILDGWDWFIQMSQNATGLLVYFLSPPLYIMAIGLIIFMTSFHYIYNFFVRFIIMGLFMRIVGK